MKRKNQGGWLLQLSQRLDFPPELIADAPLIKISGTAQVQVERHGGIAGFTPERIVVRTRRGCVRIEGADLCVAAMNRQRVVVRGHVACVVLEEE